MNWKIPLFEIYWDTKDIKAVEKIIRRGTYWSSGPEIEEFEHEIANYIGSSYSVAFNSGTSALHAALLAHGITQDEVIVPSFTFVATANAVVLAGAKPIFAEIEQESFGLDIEDVKEKINNKTKAIIPVHYGGGVCKDIKALKDIASDKKLILIEDAAESLGAKIDNKMVGSFGDSAMFSFCQNKIITAGEGGLVVTNSKDMYDKLHLICSHGRVETKEGFFESTSDLDYVQMGYNYRMSTISAALALSQFQKIDKIVKLRQEKAFYYNEKLSNIDFLRIPHTSDNLDHVYQLYTVLFENKELRDKAQNALTEKSIMSKVYFEPIHLKTFYKKMYSYKQGDLPKTEQISEKVLTLPLYPLLTTSQLDLIISTIKNIR